MGCQSSKPTTKSQQPSSPSRRKSFSEPLNKDEILKRMDCSPQTEVLEIDGVTLRYAYVSQRGYYPDDPNKDNQDAYCIFPKFQDSGSVQQAFFGVFDGHGKEGHHCAQYARDNLPIHLKSKLSEIKTELSTKAIKSSLTTAHLDTNRLLHANPSIESKLSGTTAISILFNGSTMFVSNLGDSRAVVGSRVADGHIIAQALSSDQTPYRRDERERVKKYGACIMTMDQIEGIKPITDNWDLDGEEEVDESGDPPRIWAPNGHYPGTAFSRSIGDMYAEELGVVADPEILERDLTSEDKIIIIASDGVFEFITNQMVIDMASRFSDPLDSCKAIVAEAYRMWLQYEIRTDDITIITMFVDSAPSKNPTASPPPTDSSRSTLRKSTSKTNLAGSSEEQGIQAESRPVRRTISREKRKNMIHSKSDDVNDGEEEIESSSLKVPKSAEEMQSISGAIKTNFLLQHLSSAQRTTVINVMQPVIVNAGDWVIRQGDHGDKFYVVDSGRYEVRVRPADKEDPSGGTVVHVYESGHDQHPGFGELSLMYGKPRAASVIALTPGKLWALDRRTFKKVVLQSMDTRKDSIRTLRRVELFKCLTMQQVQRLADLLREEQYPAEHHIIRQGEMGEAFYILSKGKCDCTIDQADGSSITVMQLKENDYFGERSILNSAPRSANVISRTPVSVLYIDKSAFEEVLGPLTNIIQEDRIRREAAATTELQQATPPSFTDISLIGVVANDPTGPLMLGSFGSLENLPTLSIRSFLKNEVDANQQRNAVTSSLEASRTLSAPTTLEMKNKFLPTLLQTFEDSNAIHLVYNIPVVSDLDSFIHRAPARFILESETNQTSALPPRRLKQDVLTYIAACVVASLETLHEIGIIYRTLQPESLYVDVRGRIVLLDFRVAKVGMVGNRTYTLCGAADYLAPEQISQRGHSFPVDLWALGVLLYELSVGAHPFSQPSEVATYSKISSFGSKSFPSLSFPEDMPSETRTLINQLLIPIPEARLGASGFATLKKHQLFKQVDWTTLSSNPHNLSFFASSELADIKKEKESDPTTFENILASFSQPFSGTPFDPI